MSECNSTDYSIRRANPAQAQSLSDLAVRSKAHWGYSSEFIDACRDELSYTGEQINGPQFSFFVCVVDERIVGFYAVEQVSANVAELEALFVAPEYIGRGIGRAMIEHARQCANRLGVSSLIIQGDPNAESFYLAAGAIRAGHRESNSIAGRQLPLFRIDLCQLIQSQDFHHE